MQAAIEHLRDPKQVRALAHPLRAEILQTLQEPGTAAGTARALGRTRQNVTYHLRTLEDVGLIRHVGDRRKGNFVEQLYEAVARRFVVSAEFANDAERLAAVFRDQVSLAQLSTLGERLQRDATGLAERAAHSNETVPSVTAEAEIRFADQAAREAFMREYVELLARHGSPSGDSYRVALAVHPELDDPSELQTQENPR